MSDRKRKPLKLTPRLGAPIEIDERTWLYVEHKGLCVVHRSEIFYLPWAAVRLAVSERAKPLRSLSDRTGWREMKAATTTKGEQ